MNGKRMMGVAAVVAIAGTAFTATASQAQSTTAKTEVDVAKAMRYEDAAARSAKSRTFFKEAARYYETAAGLRPAGDCKGVQDMVEASRINYYLGDERKAQSQLETAGEIALQYGDVGTAAKAFLDAAWIARQRGQHAVVVRNLLARAQKLAQSPLLDASDRDALLGRIAADAM